MNIYLNIDELVLDGLPIGAEDTSALRTALETELTHLLSGEASTAGLRRKGNLASLPITDIVLEGNHTPADLGQQIARAVYGGMKQ
jgi:hypothetical protein